MSRVITTARPIGTRRIQLIAIVVALVVAAITAVAPKAFSATPVAQRVDLRVLVLDDNSPWVDAVESQLIVEGVPYTAVPMSSSSRPTITPEFLASGDRALYQAVISPNATGGSLTTEELSALRGYEARFGIREVVGFNWANPAVGLNYAGYTGDTTGMTASVTTAGRASGFGYLNGPLPFSAGSYSYLAEPLTATSNPPMAPGASFTTLVSAPIPGSSATGSVIGVYANAGVEQMVITSAFGFYFSQFRLVAHGIVSWATRGVHLGYNRNYLTFHVDDGFASVAVWDEERKCTPGEDCPLDGDDPTPVRMTPEDVSYAAQWQIDNNYVMTIAFNGFYAAIDDPLTLAFQSQANSFKWLNHGFEHIYQGCVQDFTVIPWQCVTDQTGIDWVEQHIVYNEIQANIAQGTALGLPFNPTEYLSGEHSGLEQLPQQPADNPNFAAALTQAGISTIATDASRRLEVGQRQVGSALTIPRHPTAIFYNTATRAQAVSEYNWFYTTRANGGSGYCEDNPQTATCVAPLDPATGFMSYIVPTDAAYDLGFILSNDPRPFYAHTSNLTGDRILYPLLETILNTYRAGFQTSAPLVNLTLTEAATVLGRQQRWAATGMTGSQVNGFVENGRVTIINTGTSPVPVTVPEGTTVNGVTLEPYGGERSGWLPAAASITGTLPAPTLTVSGSTDFLVGQSNTITINASGTPLPTIAMTGALPAGVTFTVSSGTATISGTPASGSAGNYPVTITATSGSARLQEQRTLVVRQAPTITSPATATSTVGTPFSFTVMSTGSPTPTVSRSGALPAGITFTANADGTGTLSGTPTVGGTYPITFTATNAAGSVDQAFTLTVAQPPAITSANSTTATVGAAFNFAMTTTGSPTPTVTVTGALPAGITFTANGAGGGTLAGTASAGSAGSYPVTVTAQSSAGTSTQAFTLTVRQVPAFTSANSVTAAVGTAFSFTVTTSGFPASTLTRSGTLPAGVTFTPGSNGTATLAGTPTGSGGTYPQTFTATNAAGTATQAFTLTVAATQAPTFTSATSATATVGRPFSFVVTTAGSPTPTVTRTGGDPLPAGITFTANADGTATLAGTPSAGTAGNFNYVSTFRAENSRGAVTQTFALRVNEAPAFTSATSANATVGTAFSFTVRAGGFPRAALSVAGGLPAGITFTPNTNGTATLSGTATGAVGAYPLTFTATNTTASVTQDFTLTVLQRPVVTSPAIATAVAGTPFSFTMTTTGSPTPTVSRIGTLPAGITFTANANGTGTLAGTANAGTGGTYPLTLRAQNASGTTNQAFTLTVNEGPAFTTAASRNATVGTAFTFTVRTNGFPRAVLSVTGALPAGITFTAGANGTATLAGTPTGPGRVYPLTFTATNALGTANQAFTLNVR